MPQAVLRYEPGSDRREHRDDDPEGIVVVLDPEPLVDTKSGPQTAEIATATHIAKMASDAHVSVTMTRVQ